MNGTRSQIAVIDHGLEYGPVAHGRDVFFKALKKSGVAIRQVNHITQINSGSVIVIGTITDPLVQRLIGPRSTQPEGVILRHLKIDGKEVQVIAGSDDRGLMYGLLEMADRIRNGGISALESGIDIEEYPETPVRGVDRYVMGHSDDEWFYSDEFWKYFLGRLAWSRLNRFVLIMGFDTEYLTPPYPFFVEVPGYPHISVLSKQKRKRNCDQLRRIGALCHEHGVEFFLGIWQQTPWTKRQKIIVKGLPTSEQKLAAYCAKGLKTLIQACDTADGVQLRVNFEAGVGSQVSNDKFWKQLVSAVADSGRRIRLAIRAKGLSNDLIRFALESGTDLEVPTKHWCEHTGLPYHLSRMRTEELEQLDNFNHSRRYSYADMLRRPQWFDVVYRLWMYGSTCLFAWGDPDFCRRFAASSRMGGIGFEIDTALSLKGGAENLQGKPWHVYKDSALRSGGWEDERYWFRYLLFGRLGYSAKTDPEVWRRELRKRFGQQAAIYIEEAYASAGKILPLITAAHMPVHPSHCYWPEMSTGAALFTEHNYNPSFGTMDYARSEPSDSGLFYRISDYAADSLSGKIKRKYTPLQVQAWLKKLADDVRGQLSRVDKLQAIPKNLEYRQLAVDFSMLADLALYHVWKIGAALNLCKYEHSGHSDELLVSLACMTKAQEHWAALSEKGACFQDNLEFGVGPGTDRHGHWRDRLPEMQKDIAKLKEMLHAKHGLSLDSDRELTLRDDFEKSIPLSLLSTPLLDVKWPDAPRGGQDVAVSARLPSNGSSLKALQLHYRHNNQMEGEFKAIAMEISQETWHARIPASYVQKEWDMLVYISALNVKDEPVIFPGLYHPNYPFPYHLLSIADES